MISALLPLTPAFASNEPDWDSSHPIPITGRANPYGWDPATLQEKIRRGKLHALQYPVTVTGLKLPAASSLRVLELQPGDPLFGLLKTALGLDRDFKNFRGFWKWLGLNDYPLSEKAAESEIPFPNGVRPDYPMGVTLMEDTALATGSKPGPRYFTIGCAGCHSGTLFGKPVLGLTNRFPRANEFFVFGQKVLRRIGPTAYQLSTGASREDMELYRYTREHLRSIGVRSPQTLGLDTSLAQVSLSLAKREKSPWAERSRALESHPRPDYLDDHVADSKPAVWWNVKYKNRWLSDGSVLYGNPVFTNFLWNEIGRGADLPEFAKWLETNASIIEELTTAVFATEAPKWGYYLPASAINVERARRGEALFSQNCAHCHGEYLKDWSRGVETVQVRYFATTPVKEVGTDPGRREGMRALADALNPLAFSQKHHIVIKEQRGYIPPPLEGIWARYPYLHNNSIPNLCALMTPPELRPTFYYAGEPVAPGRDYDLDCVGYPSADKAPAAWKKDPQYRFETTRPGQSNSGHYARIFRINGVERYTADQKRDLIEYLKTL